MSLAVVVSNCETWPLASRCLAEICRLEPDLREVVLVDDASLEGPRTPLPPGTTIERNEERLGLPRSLNSALARRGADIVLHFDADAYPLGRFSERVRSAFESEPRLAVLGFRTVGEGGRPTSNEGPCPRLSSLILGLRLGGILGGLASRQRGERSVFAAAMAMRREFFLEVGGFDPSLGFLDLDHDLCMKAWERNWTVRLHPELVAFHEGGGSGVGGGERVRGWHRSRWLLLAHHGMIRKPSLVKAAVGLRLRAERSIFGLLALFDRGQRARWREKAAVRSVILDDLRSGYE